MTIPVLLYAVIAVLCVSVVVDYFTNPHAPWLRTVNMVAALIVGVVLLVLFVVAR